MANKRIAFQGEIGAFSERAATELVGGRFRPQPCETFDQVFDAVAEGRAEAGVVPIENSLVGTIHKVYDLLLDHELQIVDECQLRIVHCLIAPRGVKLSQVKRVYSHPVALDQCRTFFATRPNLQPRSYYDTAGAVKMLAEKNVSDAAAIAGPFAAVAHDMQILRKSIEDEKQNYTRFILLGRKAKRFSGQPKSSIAFSMKSVPGALFKALSVFALRDINLTRIESRPVRKTAWQYHFYIDFEGSTSEERVRCALDHLSEITHFIKILGCYPHRVKRG